MSNSGFRQISKQKDNRKDKNDYTVAALNGKNNK